MLDFQFSTPANIFFGKNSVEQLPKLIGENIRKVMLVYGGQSAKMNGAYDSVTATLKESKIQWIDFGGNTAPSYQKALEAIRICKEEQVGCVIGIGGCTCMDMAKVIAFGAKNNDLWDYLSFARPLTGTEEHLLIGAVPTYPSGGSEADEAAEIDNMETGEHGSLYGIYADFSILNPEFTYTLDKKNTAYAAMVTFAQASVCYLGGYSPISEHFTLAVLDTIRSSVKTALENPIDYDARAGQMWASALSTMGILSCGKDKSWAWSLYSDLEIIRKCMDIPYRQAFTVLFPRWLKAKAVLHGDDVRRYMVSVMGVDGSLPVEEAVNEGVRRIIEMFTLNGLSMTYNAFGEIPSKERLEKEAEIAAAENELSAAEIVSMFTACIA